MSGFLFVGYARGDDTGRRDAHQNVLRRLAFIVFAFDQTFASQVATMEGIGPVKIGITVQEAEQALGAKLDPISPPFYKECWITSRSG